MDYIKMEIYRAKPATKQEMCQFHTDEYIDFISRVNPDNLDLFTKEQIKFNVGDDCPVLMDYLNIVVLVVVDQWKVPPD